MRNTRLLIIAVVMLPIVVISFVFKRQETNFNLEQYGPYLEEYEHSESDFTYIVRVEVDEEVKTLELEDYVIGVVAGEMPASFESEALKAQAVAARTFALYKNGKNEKTIDLTSGTGTQVYIDSEEMQKKWGVDYQKYYDKIKDTVMATASQVMTYDGSLIEAFYFAMSSGSTNDSVAVFGEARDYLQSVESIYDNSDLRGYETVYEMDSDEFKRKLGLECENVSVEEVKRNASHYVDTISICGEEFKGVDVRLKLGLRSADFDIDVEHLIHITTRGYGHGVGMSQYGANGYAKSGYTYEEILKHYYKNIEIIDIKDV